MVLGSQGCVIEITTFPEHHWYFGLVTRRLEDVSVQPTLWHFSLEKLSQFYP